MPISLFRRFLGGVTSDVLHFCIHMLCHNHTHFPLKRGEIYIFNHLIRINAHTVDVGLWHIVSFSDIILRLKLKRFSIIGSATSSTVVY